VVLFPLLIEGLPSSLLPARPKSLVTRPQRRSWRLPQRRTPARRTPDQVGGCRV